MISEDYSIEKNGSLLSDLDVSNHSLGFKNKIVFSDGKLISTPKMEGITFSDFSDFECSDSDSILKLNSALANNGFTIKVDSNTMVDGVIEIVDRDNNKTEKLSYDETIKFFKNITLEI